MLFRLSLVIILISNFLFSEETQFQIDGLGDPNSYVGGCVSVTSGAFVHSIPDITIDLPEPITFTRNYSSNDVEESEFGTGFMHNHVTELLMYEVEKKKKKTKYCLLGDRSGSRLLYKGISGDWSDSYKLDKDQFKQGLTNLFLGNFSGRFNPINTSLTTSPVSDNYTLWCPDGSVRSYTNEKILSYDRRPSGNYFSYHTNDAGRINKISILDSSWKKTLGWIHFQYNNDGDSVNIQASNGFSAWYSLESKNMDYKRTKKKFLKSFNINVVPRISYVYSKEKTRGWPYTKYSRRLTSVLQGNRTKIALEYSGDKVSRLKFPYSNRIVSAYTFLYKKDFTVVKNYYGQTTVYNINKSKNLSSKKVFLERPSSVSNSRPYRYERYSWFRGNIVQKSIADADGRNLSMIKNGFDIKGNLLLEKIYGNLTGESEPQPILFKKQKLVNKVDSYAKVYSYNAWHLPLVEKEDDGSEVRWTYLDKSGRPLIKLLLSNGQIVGREFYGYNSFGIQVFHQVDDGVSEDKNSLEGATYCSITRSVIDEESGSYGIGRPLQTIKSYVDLDSEEEIQLHRTVYTYGKFGLVTSETHYDCNDQFGYTLNFDYDSRGNCIRKTDPLGIETLQEFNADNQVIRKEIVGSGFYTTYEYDSSDRLAVETEHHDSGLTFTNKQEYNVYGLKTHATDRFGNRTSNSYDPLGRLIEVELPSMKTYDGEVINPKKTNGYDIWDHVTVEIDPKGNEVRKNYTCRGQPTCIQYPDGTREEYRYGMNGVMFKKIERSGTYAELIYDDQKRVIEDRTFNRDGDFLRSKQFTYNRSQLAFEIDPLGVMTEYRYDKAGRKQCSLVHGEGRILKEEYAYDSWGRLDSTTKWVNEFEYIRTIQVFDFLDRVIEERTEDSNGRVLAKKTFAYDINGNKVEETLYLDEETVSTTKWLYSSYNELMVQTDPLGYETRYTYDFEHENDIGQKVLKVECTDPSDVTTDLIKDSYGRNSIIKKFDTDGTLLSSEHFYYDACGQKVAHITDVISKGVITRSNEVLWDYDTMGRPVKVIEDPEKKNKITSYEYNSMGAISAKILPDGVKITYEYDDLAREVSQKSSDGSIHFTYTYDLNDHLLTSTDEITGETLVRTYDDLGNLSSERLPNGLFCSYTYDSLRRILSFEMDDGTLVEYSYEGTEVKSVSRFNANHERLYQHVYDKSNWQGRSEVSTFINGQTVTFDWDLMGRLRNLESETFSQMIPEDGYDSVGNLLRVDSINNGYSYTDTYRYDSLRQLIEEDSVSHNTYTSDSMYNRLSKNDAVYEINSLNQIDSDGEADYRYNLNGNLIEASRGEIVTQYSYDALNRLKEVFVDQQWRIEYFYDSYGRRVCSKHYQHQDGWSLERTQRYLFQGIYEVGCVDEDGTIQQMRVMGKRENTKFRASVAIELDGNIYVPLYDHRFNIVSLLSMHTDQQVQGYRYSAFGEHETLLVDGVASPWLFGNKRYEERSNFYNFGKRDYSPVMGRWISPDPGDFVDGANLYAYTHNSPLANLDFFGYFSVALSLTPDKITEPDYLKRGNKSVSRKVNQYFEYARIPGKCVSAAARHLSAPSHAQYFMEGIGLILQGQCPVHEFAGDFVPVSGSVGGEPLSNIRVRCVTGILTEPDSCESFARQASKYLNNSKVYYTCNQTVGFMGDSLTTIQELFSASTVGVQHLTDQIKNDYKEMRQLYGDDFHLVIFAHSRGGLELYQTSRNLSFDERQKIDAYTFGSAKIVGTQTFGGARNYANPCDIVHQMALLTGNVEAAIIIYTNYYSCGPQALIIDHFMDCEGYDKALFDVCKEVLK